MHLAGRGGGICSASWLYELPLWGCKEPEATSLPGFLNPVGFGVQGLGFKVCLE